MIRRFVVGEAYTKNSTFSTMRSKDGRMRKLLPWGRRGSGSSPRSEFLCFAPRIHVFIDSKKPLAPPVPVVSACKELSPGRTRSGEQNGFQFDVAAKNFAISEGTQDMPPAEHGFRLRSRNSGSLLDISHSASSQCKAWRRTLLSHFPIMSRNVTSSMTPGTRSARTTGDISRPGNAGDKLGYSRAELLQNTVSSTNRKPNYSIRLSVQRASCRLGSRIGHL